MTDEFVINIELQKRTETHHFKRWELERIFFNDIKEAMDFYKELISLSKSITRD